MSAGEEYVIRISWPGVDGAEASRPFDVSYTSEERAREALAVLSFDKDETATVHKLGPAIPAPEPREWVVVRTDGTAHLTILYTLREAELMVAGMGKTLRIMRVVPEDGAQ